jgi:hypothetical protein
MPGTTLSSTAGVLRRPVTGQTHHEILSCPISGVDAIHIELESLGVLHWWRAR